MQWELTLTGNSGSLLSVYFICSSVCLLIPSSGFISPVVTVHLSSESVGLFLLCESSPLCRLGPTCKCRHRVLSPRVRLASLGVIIPGSIHVAEGGIFSCRWLSSDSQSLTLYPWWASSFLRLPPPGMVLPPRTRERGTLRGGRLSSASVQGPLGGANCHIPSPGLTRFVYH